VDRAQLQGVESVQTLFACLAVPHQADLSQNSQMLGCSWLGHAQLFGQLGHRSFTGPQNTQDRATLRLGNRVEDV
jgi:hypothetical protein